MNPDASFYNNATVLITGASMGLGKALALQLAPYHTNLILCARSLNLLEELRDECYRLGANKVSISACDVTDMKQCEQVVKRGLDECQIDHLDVLLLNAGISGSIEFEQMSSEQVSTLFRKMWEVNFMGYVHFVHYCLPYLQKKSKSRATSNIGVISSMSGMIGVPFRTAYCSSKYAVNGFFEVLRNELNVKYKQQHNNKNLREVKITVVMPGWIDTGLRDRHLVEAHKDQYVDKSGPTTSTSNNNKQDSSKVMSVEQCVRDVLCAIRLGKREERFIFKQKIVPFLKAISPETVDSMISKHVNASAVVSSESTQSHIQSKL